MERRPQKNAGLTAIEMLVATALAVLLISALVPMFSLSPAERAIVELGSDDPAWFAQVIATLRADLENARGVTITDDTLTLLGDRSLARKTMEFVHQPVLVEYVVVHGKKGRWLVRWERRLEDLANRNQVVELLTAGVESFRLALPEEEDPEVEPRAQRRTLPAFNAKALPDLAPLPRRLAVELILVGGASPLRRLIVLR